MCVSVYLSCTWRPFGWKSSNSHFSQWPPLVDTHPPWSPAPSPLFQTLKATLSLTWLPSFLPSFVLVLLSSSPLLPYSQQKIPENPFFFCNPAQLVGEQGDEHGPDVWDDERGRTSLPSDLSPGSAEKQRQKLAWCVSPWEVLTMWLKSWGCSFREQIQFKLDKDGDFLKNLDCRSYVSKELEWSFWIT